MTGFLSCISYTQTYAFAHTHCRLYLRSDSYELSSNVILGMSSINYDKMMTIAWGNSPSEDNRVCVSIIKWPASQECPSMATCKGDIKQMLATLVPYLLVSSWPRWTPYCGDSVSSLFGNLFGNIFFHNYTFAHPCWPSVHKYQWWISFPEDKVVILTTAIDSYNKGAASDRALNTVLKQLGSSSTNVHVWGNHRLWGQQSKAQHKGERSQ